MKTPILGSAYVARSVNAADSRMVNLFPEVIPEGGKEAAFLQRAPGLSTITTLGSGADAVRGLWTFGGFLYAVCGNKLYKIDDSYTATELGTIANTGPVSMADNGTQLFIAANGPGYIYNATTDVFAPITDPDFTGAATVTYLDGYFVFNEPDSQLIWVTQLLDGTSVDPLDFASAEGDPDDVVAIIADHRELWVYGTNSVEVWYNSGAADFPLQRIQGAFNEIGCAAPNSVAKMDNGLFWLGKDARGHGMVYNGRFSSMATCQTPLATHTNKTATVFMCWFSLMPTPLGCTMPPRKPGTSVLDGITAISPVTGVTAKRFLTNKLSWATSRTASYTP